MLQFHQFLLQIWQAMYGTMVCAFKTRDSEKGINAPNLRVQFSDSIDPSLVLSQTEAVIQGSELFTHAEFRDFVSSMADADDTWKFWNQLRLPNQT